MVTGQSPVTLGLPSWRPHYCRPPKYKTPPFTSPLANSKSFFKTSRQLLVVPQDVLFHLLYVTELVARHVAGQLFPRLHCSWRWAQGCIPANGT